MLYRIRPEAKAFVDHEGETPSEVHFLSFNSEEDLLEFLQDGSRLEFVHLKDESVKSVLLVKGEKM
ncbi:MAG: hypothetical protein AB8B56_01035 [Crocinitomicaceae bacterium]